MKVKVIAKVNRETQSGGGINRFVTGLLEALGKSCYLTVVSASSQPNRGASRAPGAPSHLGRPAAILGEASNPCWSALTVGGAFEGPSLLLSPTLSLLGK